MDREQPRSIIYGKILPYPCKIVEKNVPSPTFKRIMNDNISPIPSEPEAPELQPDPVKAATPAEQPAAAPSDDAPPENSPLEEAEERIRILEDQILRVRADFDNYRKRTLREREEWTQRSIENLLQDLLPILDNFEMGMERAQADQLPDAMLEGFRMTTEQLVQSLRKYGLETITSLQAPFDPLVHEAIQHMPNADVQKGTVLLEARKGYKLGTRTLRPAQVIVSSGSPDAPNPDQKDDQ